MSKNEEVARLLPKQGKLEIPPYFQFRASSKTSPAVTILADFQRIYYSKINACASPSRTKGHYGDSNGPAFGWRDAAIAKLRIHLKLNEGLTLRLVATDVSRVSVRREELLANMLSLGVFDEQLSAGLSWQLDSTTTLDIGAHKSLRQRLNGENPYFPGQKLGMSNEVTTLELGWRHQF